VRAAEEAADRHVLLQIQHMWHRHASTLQSTIALCERHRVEACSSATSAAQAEMVALASALLDGLVRVYFDVRTRIERRAAQSTTDCVALSSAAEQHATVLHTAVSQSLRDRHSSPPVVAIPLTTSKSASAVESLRLAALDLAWCTEWQCKLAPVLIAWAAAPAPPHLNPQVFMGVVCGVCDRT
jgi:hypothetical protein